MKKKILFFAATGSLLLTLFIASCTKDIGKAPVASVPVSACDTITYTKHIKPIIDGYCISCHGNPPNAGAPILMSYADVKTNSSKIKATTLDANPKPELMPQGGPPLPQNLKEQISCWLNNGMKE
jgi:hypothetical protein